MPTDLLLASAREMADEEAGGHGDRWSVLSSDVPALLNRWLRVAVAEGEVSSLGMTGTSAREHLRASGEPAAAGMLYAGPKPRGGPVGMMLLLHSDAGADDYELWSAYPFLGGGVVVEAEVEQVHLFPNRIEAWLDLGLSSGGRVTAFDALFWDNRAVYRAGARYSFQLSALAYRIGPTRAAEHVIDDEHEIRRFRAREAWIQAHGGWTAADEEASLAAWQPASPADLEPVRIDMSERGVLMRAPSGGADDAAFHGRVMQVIPRAAHLLEAALWRVDTMVMRADGALVLPIYVAEHRFEGDWRPQVGQVVSGTLWLQAHAPNRLDGPAPDRIA